MSRISVATRVRCDRCGDVFQEDSHHARAVLKIGFGDLGGPSGRVGGVYDLCDACEREVRGFIEKQPKLYGDKHEMG